jgi:hypothetical protein
VLNHPPKLACELALGKLFVDGPRVIPRLDLYKPASNGAFQIARVGAPIEIGRLAIDQHVKQLHRRPPRLSFVLAGTRFERLTMR